MGKLWQFFEYQIHYTKESTTISPTQNDRPKLRQELIEMRNIIFIVKAYIIHL